MAAVSLSVPRNDPTSREAIARADREPMRRLEVSIADRCGERLIDAFERLARAYYERSGD